MLRDRGSRLVVATLLGILAAHAAHAATSTKLARTIPNRVIPSALTTAAPDLSPRVLALALGAADCAQARGVATQSEVLTIIDYSLPSTTPRLWVLDRASGKLLFRDLVAHGAGTGDNLARKFSNVEGSRQTSLGLFRTGATYEGGNGYSLYLHGLEPGINDQALSRTIVMHGAWYVSEEHARQYGRLGRSWGCPALPMAHAKPVIDAIKGGSLVFAYYPDQDWLDSSRFLSACGARPADGGSVVAAGAGR